MIFAQFIIFPRRLIDCSLNILQLQVVCSPGGIDVNPDRLLVGISGYGREELDSLLTARGLEETAFGYNERFYFYDIIWTAALSLNLTIAKLPSLLHQGVHELHNFQ